MVSNPTNVLQVELNRLRHENDQLRGELQILKNFVDILQTLAEAAEEVNSSRGLMALLSEITLQTLDLLDAPDGSLLLLDSDSGELEFVIVHGAARDELTGRRLKPKEGIAGWVAATGKTTIVRDARTDPRFSSRMDETVAFKTQSIAAAPLVGNAQIQGVIEVLNQPGDEPFNELDRALLMLFCRFAGQTLVDIEAKLL